MMGGVDGVGKGGDDSDITNDYDSDGDDGIMLMVGMKVM